MPSSTQEVHRVLKRLRLLIYLSPLNQRQVESRAGFSKGYLSQIVCGNIDLKFRHLITILTAADIDPGIFFAELYPRRRGDRIGHLLESFMTRSRPIDPPLRRQLVRLYGMGLESLEELCERLDRCEDAFSELEAMGILERETM